MSSLGILVGTLFHKTAAAPGISAVLVSSSPAFAVVKYAGAAYLMYLGIGTLLNQKNVPVRIKAGPEKSLGGTFFQGIVVNVLNPKTALFFTAFLPQFIKVEKGSAAAQIFFLGAVSVLLGAVSDVTYALLAGRAGNWLQGSILFQRAQRYLAGSVYVGLGAAAALSGMSRK